MEIKNTFIKDLIIIKPKIFPDKRGYFFEAYNKQKFIDAGINIDFIQDNQSYSTANVIRGLHYQAGEYSQAKLVRVLKGKIIDVAVDLRRNSDTFGKHFAVELSEENKLQFLIPRGFAHGFSVISNDAILLYKCDNIYNKQAERGIIYNDPTINIDWKVQNQQAIVSEKDLQLPTFADAETFN